MINYQYYAIDDGDDKANPRSYECEAHHSVGNAKRRPNDRDHPNLWKKNWAKLIVEALCWIVWNAPISCLNISSEK